MVMSGPEVIMRKICITGLLVAVSLLFACKNPSNSTVPENQNEATDSNSTENEKTPAAIVPTSKVQFNFSGAKAIAQLESVSDDSRAADDDNLREYITNYLTIVLDNMPLDTTYADYVREYVNKIYYDYKDRGPYIGEKRYGYSQYLFRNLMDMKCSFYLKRGEEVRCVIRKY